MTEHQSLNTQVGFLIAHLTRVSPKTDQKRFASLKSTALQRLRSHRGTSIDQFEVDRRLDGLQEKFSVLDRDDLAEALGHRINALSKRSDRYVPEYLTLIVELSGRQISRRAVEDLVKPQEDEPASGLSWEEIIADEPLNETGVWDDVDFEASSDDDSLAEHEIQTLRPFSESDDSSDQTPPEKAHVELLGGDSEGFKIFQQQLFWDRKNGAHENNSPIGTVNSPFGQRLSAISELQAVRECILMLQGHPTSLFQRVSMQGALAVSGKYTISHIAIDRFRGILKAFVSVGNDICTIRQLASRSQFEPFLQAFWNSVNLRLRDFDQYLVDQEFLILQKKADVIVSITDLYQAASLKSRNLRDLLSKLDKRNLARVEDGSSYRLLNVLHDATCTSQLTSDGESYEFYSQFFLDCLKFYLVPIRQWMGSGELLRVDAMAFISKKSDSRMSSVQIPSEQGEYKLKTLENQELLWPTFFTEFIEPIFAIGKSAIILGQLGVVLGEESAWPRDEKQLVEVFRIEVEKDLMPFSESLKIVLGNWINGQYQLTSSALRKGLSTQCDIAAQFDALEHIYLFKDGSASKQFTNKLFEQMDGVKARWNDPYLLTEWARTTIGTTPSVDADSITTRLVSGRYEDIQTARRTVKSLEGLRMNFTLPWLMGYIISPESTTSLQRVFVFLLQILRSKYVLEQMKILTKGENLSEDSEEHTLFLRIRHRLLWVVNVLFSHLTELVIEVACREVRLEYQNILDLDQMASLYETFTRQLEVQCLLSKSSGPMQQAIVSLLDLAILFSDLHDSHEEEQAMDLTNRSFSFSISQTSDSYKRRKRHKNDNSSSEGEAESDEEGVDRSHINFFESSYLSRMRNVDNKTGQLISFIGAGLHGLCRATSEPTLEILVQRLDWERFGRTK